MLRIGPLDLSPANRTPIWSDGHTVPMHKTALLRPDPARAVTANAFLVDQPPLATIRPHYHANSQFQVFVGGSGTLGRRPVQGFVAQYVARHTGYGPIVAGDHGLWYLTLRPSAPSGAQYLPDKRDALDMAAPKRQVTSEAFDAPLPVSQAGVEVMIPPEADGLAGWMLSIPPGGSMAPPEHPGGLARYYVVATGQATVNGTVLGPLGLAWAEGDDLCPALHAGSQGANVIALQFPAGDAAG